MSHSSYTGYGSRSLNTPQTEPIPGSNQVRNNAGGFSFAVDDMTRLTRFLILSSTGGTYYVGERKLTKENLDVVERLLKAGQGKAVVDRIVEISDAGRAASNDPALFALARCCACEVHGKIEYLRPAKTYTLHRAHHEELFEKHPNEGELPFGKGTAVRQGETITVKIPASAKPVQLDHPDDIAVRQYAYAAVPAVARTGTHFLHFLEYVKQFRGRGRAHQRASRAWYEKKSVERLAYQVLKYQQRDGWSQRDVLRLAHPKPSTVEREMTYHWIVKGELESSEQVPDDSPLALLKGYEQVKKADTDKEVAQLIKQYRLPREAIPTQHLKSVRVWEALLEEMPMEAMTRNLATMTRNGVLEENGSFTRSVTIRLRSREAIQKARLHPIKLLAALMTYQSGKSTRGSHTWNPLREIVDALNDAFYLSFQSLVPSRKRLVLALDVSGSMTMGTVGNVPGLTPRIASAALALVTAATESHYSIMAFSQGFIPLTISPKQRLDDVVRTVSSLPFDGTDCSLPMLWALQHQVQADAFIVYTDSETYAGRMHPVQALNLYRQRMGIPAKLIVVGMTSTQFTIADPDDAGMLDVVGFDTNVPDMMSAFIRGDI